MTQAEAMKRCKDLTEVLDLPSYVDSLVGHGLSEHLAADCKSMHLRLIQKTRAEMIEAYAESVHQNLVFTDEMADRIARRHELEKAKLIAWVLERQAMSEERR